MPYTKDSPIASVRRQHLGWALYARIADTACYLRSPKKCQPPPTLLNRPELPKTLFWPLARDWLNCQAMIEAVVNGNLHHLDQIAMSYPSYRFGFEEYAFQLRDIIHASKRVILPTVANVAPKALVVSAVQLLYERVPAPVPEPGLHLRLELLYWDSAQTSIRLRIVLPIPAVKTVPATEQVFTTVLIDTVTGHWGLEEHRPGWYRAYGLRPDLWKAYLGLGLRKTAQRRSLPASGAEGKMRQEADACSTSDSSTRPPGPSAMPSEPNSVLSS